MSVIEKIQNLFKPVDKLPEDSMDMSSVGMPVDPFATGTMQANITGLFAAREPKEDGFPVSRLADPEPDAATADDSDLIRLPLLGSKTIAQHQRTLLIGLGLSVLVLGVVAYRALNQADTIAKEITATGQSLMQSQRLAKSVSQALVGSAQAFPDVKESAGVLAKTVRGLKKGDDTMGLSPVRFLVTPRIIAAVLMTPLLTLFSDLVGLLGGALTMQSFSIPLVTFLKEVDSAVNLPDFLAGFVKSFVFAMLVAGIGCLRGLQTKAGASAVGDAATRAVVSGIILLVVVDGLFAVAYFLLDI